MNGFLEIPFAARLALVFLVGLAAGGAFNWAIYTLAWRPKNWSPWSKTRPQDEQSGWLDRVPLWGWWRLRRKGPEWGEGFWWRPITVELLSGFLFAGLYYLEVGRATLLAPRAGPLSAADTWALHAIFASHAILASFMVVATFIDIDDFVIPDSVTVPGTLLGLGLATIFPATLPPASFEPASGAIERLNLVSPEDWPDALAGFPRATPLMIAGGCYLAWCVALLPRLWRPSKGWRKAFRLMFAHMGRSRTAKIVIWLAVIGGPWIGVTWRVGGESWRGLLTSLVGMAAGGALVWSVRVAGGWALGREAMGFGDVTLLAMIGAFLGWQPAVVIFFMAPLAAVVIGLIRVAMRLGREIPYGPFLCLATLLTCTHWGALWRLIEPSLEVGWLLPAALAVCMLALPMLLYATRMFLDLLGVQRE